MTKQQQRKDLNETIELSLAPKNLDAKENVRFERKRVKIKDLDVTFKTRNYSPIIWRDGYRDSKNFAFATGFVVDIDKGLSIDKAEARLQELSLNYLIVPSKRYTPENHRFHIFLFFNYPVYCVNTYKKLTERISTEIFPETDDSTLDAARFLFGSPDHVNVSSYLGGNDFDVLTIGAIWDDDLTVIDSKGREINVSEIKEKTSIYCPFHRDNNHSAFIKYSEKSENWFIHCSACTETFWQEKRPESLEERCIPYWSYGTDVFELGVLNDEFFIEKIGKSKFHILTDTNYIKEERDRAFEFLVKRKHINHISRIDYLGDINIDESFYNVRLNDGIIDVHHTALPVDVEDNKFIEEYLEDRFGRHKDFIKEYLAIFCYTNYRNLPTLILKGPRGNGKSTFAEITGEIFRPLTFEWHGHEESFTYEVEKKLLIVEENESTKMSQYKTLKKYSGQKNALVKKKFKDPYMVLNNMNIILLTNESIPLYVSREELPKDEFNNQFFVYEFPEIEGSMDPQIQDKILKRLGHYIRTELRSVYNQISNYRYRYSIRVPITDAERALFIDNVTDAEADTDKFIQKLVLYYSPNGKGGAYADFIDQGYLPSQFFRDFDISNIHYNRVVKNLKKRRLLIGDPKRIQLNEVRHYCYEMTDKLKDEIDQASFECP